MKRIKYLVTGAAGNLGRSIVRKLVEEGKAVRALVLQGDRAAERLPKEIELVAGDVTDYDSLDRFFDIGREEEAIVVHCASVVAVSPEFSKRVFDVNVVGTGNIVDKCVIRGVKKLVYVSSTSAIPEMPKNQPITEVERFDSAEVRGFYAQTKAEATRIVMDAVRENGLNASVVFPSDICGPGDYAYGSFSTFIAEYAKGTMKGGVAGSFNVVDVRDLAAGVVACCERGGPGEGYIMANERVAMEEMFGLLSARTGAPEITTMVPPLVAYTVAAVAGFIGKLTVAHPRLTTFAVYNLVRNNNFSSAKARRELGFSTRPFAETLTDTVAWLKEEGKI